MEYVTQRDEDGLRTLLFDAGAANLLSPASMGALRDALGAANDDDAVSAILLTSSGDVFCGGLDIAKIRAGADPVEFARSLVTLLHLLAGLGKPIAAVVQGDALAGGAGLVAGVDYAVASAHARLGSHEVSVGIWPMIAQVPLVQRIGVRHAMENIGAGEPFSAERAREVGLVQAIAEGDEARALAEEWLRRAQRGAGAYALGRPSFYEFAAMPYPAALDAALARFASMFPDS